MICGLSPYTANAKPFKCDLDPIFGYLPPNRFGHSVSITPNSDTIAIGELHDRSSMNKKFSNNNEKIKMQNSQAYILRKSTDLITERISYIPDQIVTSWDRPYFAPDGDEGYDDYGAR
jgi:hypothetical protein